MINESIAAGALVVTGAANERLDAVNGLLPVTRRPAARCGSERRKSSVVLAHGTRTSYSAGMQ